eukprot:m.78168 g.78168  ORF g.78168 m.78168 type:complete len:313 (-) comp25088_c0_seq1:267-1205(-)
MSQRIYHVWPGNNCFLFFGRLSTSSETGGVHFTYFMLLLTLGMFHGFSSPYLWHHISPVIPIVCAYFGAFALLMLFRTHLTDPGIIPRASKEEGDLSSDRDGSGVITKLRTVTIHGQGNRHVVEATQTLKFCETCHVYRPPRAHHCGSCDNCIDGFDHHCPWVGNCIGKRNYRYFTLFVMSIIICCVLYFGASVYHLVHVLNNSDMNFGRVLSNYPSIAVVPIACFFTFFTVGGLGAFHAGLFKDGVTTNEYIKGTFKNRNLNPFYKGSMWNNLVASWFGPRSPSVCKFRDIVTDETDKFVDFDDDILFPAR